jgi:hypothetical protein
VKRVLRSAGWLLIGWTGTALIFTAAYAVVGSVVPVSLQPGSTWMGSWDEYVHTRGTWTMENETLASPLQTTEIFCDRQQMQCTEAQAEVFGGMLSSQLIEYQITRWDSNVITFANTSSTCVDYNYTLDRASQRLIGVRTTKKSTTCPLPISDKSITLTLADGFSVWRRVQDEAAAKVHPFMWVGLALWWVFIGWKALQQWRRA